MVEFKAVEGAAVCSAKEEELRLVMEKANALFFSSLAEADPREVIDFVATELRDKLHINGELQLHLQGEPGVIEASMMWVDPTGPTGGDEWLAAFMIPKHWKLKLPSGHKARPLGSVKVVELDGPFDVYIFGHTVAWCEVGLSRPTQRELDRRELYEALHLE